MSVGALGGVLVALWSMLAPGEPGVPELRSPAAEAVVLSWQAPASCPDQAAVRRGLATVLGEGPSAEAGAGVRAVARVHEEGGRLHLELRTETPSGVTTRETVADDCAVLVEATALIVAIAVDPTAVLGRGETLAEPEPSPVEPEPPDEAPAVVVEPMEPADPETRLGIEPVEAADREVEPTTDPRIRFGMRVAGAIDGGSLPGVAGGLRVTGAVLGRRWRAELGGDYWLPRTATAEPGIGGRIGLGSGAARGCGVPGIDRVGLEIPLCAGVEAGILRGDPAGDRVANPVTARVPWVAATAGAGVAWTPRRFIALVLQGEVVLPIARTGFVVGDVEVYRVGAVAGRGTLGIEVRFP
ncbi:hypothetical protein [Paraliomyxa miuraensis]|uniref:hypothetical protein n=1 Tax=Paraliomyxa miuraensis TaxID=376150 RepID=UPI0022512883|nr:hypothetical protein [Paraliomyxa miuraensis]MCX4246857.1 hypothetical protein [Paraliomyxa miuraensis]